MKFSTFVCVWESGEGKKREGKRGALSHQTVFFFRRRRRRFFNHPSNRAPVKFSSLSLFSQLFASFAASSLRTYLEADDAPAGGGSRGCRGGFGGVAERSMQVRRSSGIGVDVRSRGVARLGRRLELHFLSSSTRERAGPGEKERGSVEEREKREREREKGRERVKEEEEGERQREKSDAFSLVLSSLKASCGRQTSKKNSTFSLSSSSAVLVFVLHHLLFTNPLPSSSPSSSFPPPALSRE